MQIQLNQQQLWLAEQAADAEDADDMAAFLTEVVRRYLGTAATTPTDD